MKTRWSLLPWQTIEHFVKVLMAGSSKYPLRGWEDGRAYSEHYDAAIRHLTAFWNGEDKDPETKLSHLAHAGTRVMFLLTYQLRGMRSFDDRPKKDVLPKDGQRKGQSSGT